MKAFRLNDSTVVLIEQLAERYEMTQTQLLEAALYSFASSDGISKNSLQSDTPAEKPQIIIQSQSSGSDAALAKHIDKIITMLKAVDESCYHQLNLLNSLCDNIAATDIDTYADAKTSPTSWMVKSQEQRRNTINNTQTRKILNQQ